MEITQSEERTERNMKKNKSNIRDLWDNIKRAELHIIGIPEGEDREKRMSTLITSIQHNIGSPSHSNQTRKRNKRYPNWKGRGKTVIIHR